MCRSIPIADGRWRTPAIKRRSLLLLRRKPRSKIPTEIERLAAAALPIERAASCWIVSDDADEHIDKIMTYVALGFAASGVSRAGRRPEALSSTLQQARAVKLRTKGCGGAGGRSSGLTANFTADAASLLLDARGVVEPAKRSRCCFLRAMLRRKITFAKLVMGRRSIRRYRAEPVDEVLCRAHPGACDLGALGAQPPTLAVLQRWGRRSAERLPMRWRRGCTLRPADGRRRSGRSSPPMPRARSSRLTEAPALDSGLSGRCRRWIAILDLPGRTGGIPDGGAEHGHGGPESAVGGVTWPKGFRSCVLCAPLFCPDTVVEALRSAAGLAAAVPDHAGLASECGQDGKPQAACRHARRGRGSMTKVGSGRALPARLLRTD